MQNDQQQLVTPDQVIESTPPLYLPIADETILQTLNYAEQRARVRRSELNVDNRADTNIRFWKGNQVDAAKLDLRYQEMHVDNVVRQDLENKIKLATGHTPDIFCAPPDKQDFNTEAAMDMQSYLRDRLSSSTNKRLLKNGLRKLDLELIAVIKCRYDNRYQRSSYELVDSKHILFGEGATVREDGYTIDGTRILFQYVEEDTQIVLNTFPKKANELMQLLAANGKDIPSRITYTEAHFEWTDQQGTQNQGVAMRFGQVLLDKMREPYYDYDNTQINYFDRARKPYILFSYANLGESVYESTTDFEQGIALNRMINRRRRQITEIADRSIPKLAFLNGAMTKDLAQAISTNPQEAIILSDGYTNDDITKAMAVIPAAPPNAILYNDLMDLRGRLNSLFAVQGATNVEAGKNVGESGVSKQITREGDLVTSDDIVDITLERVLFEMASWETQFLRLFHDDDRPPLRITNSEGETDIVQLSRKKIETDLQIVVKASSTDKQTRRADALQLLTAKAIDPYTLFEDLGVNNPRERMRRLTAFIKGSQSGDLAGYMETIGVDEETPFATAEDAERDIDILSQGQQVMVKLPGEAYVAAFKAFKQSPEYTQLQPYAQQAIEVHIQRLRQIVDEQLQKQQQSQGMDSAMMQAGQPQPTGMPDTAGAFMPQQGQLGNALAQALQRRQQTPQPQAQPQA
jgi:hypothetical protein